MTSEKKFKIGSIQVTLEEAPELKFPSNADCNSPIWWRDGLMYVLTSIGHPTRSFGPDVESLGNPAQIVYSTYREGGRWIKSVHQMPDGTLYGWYHNEPSRLPYIPEPLHEGHTWRLTAPFIGALRSVDNGMTWDDLGIVISFGPETLNLETPNFFFAGGNGDFSVILDRKSEYFYFALGTYHKDVRQQGIALARMRYSDLDGPVGNVYKWHNGGWGEPGINGSVTPIIPVNTDWYNPNPDTFWGPSVHWNTHLKQYVILMNRAIDPRWKQEGIYISISPDITDPNSWTPPLKILDGQGWYPQVVGLDTARHETERESGANNRLFIHGISRYFIRFD